MNGHRDSLLREMGLAPIWRLRGGSGADAPGAEVQGDEAAPGAGCAAGSFEASPFPGSGREEQRPSPVAASAAAALHERVAPPAAPGLPSASREAPPTAAVDGERTGRIAGLEWDALEADIRACRACRLCERRRQAVPGVGDRQADWMFVGEGPGAEEDQRGEPFVGAAGRLLDAMLAALNLKRGDGVYIANAVKCRPPHNRTPESDELDACAPYLARQIALVRPRLLVALGRPAARALLGDDVAIGAARGKVFDRGGVPVVVTYHPAYLLRNQRDKGKVWEDLCFARRLMSERAAG